MKVSTFSALASVLAVASGHFSEVGESVPQWWTVTRHSQTTTTTTRTNVITIPTVTRSVSSAADAAKVMSTPTNIITIPTVTRSVSSEAGATEVITSWTDISTIITVTRSVSSESDFARIATTAPALNFTQPPIIEPPSTLNTEASVNAAAVPSPDITVTRFPVSTTTTFFAPAATGTFAPIRPASYPSTSPIPPVNGASGVSASMLGLVVAAAVALAGI